MCAEIHKVRKKPETASHRGAAPQGLIRTCLQGSGSSASRPAAQSPEEPGAAAAGSAQGAEFRSVRRRRRRRMLRGRPGREDRRASAAQPAKSRSGCGHGGQPVDGRRECEGGRGLSRGNRSVSREGGCEEMGVLQFQKDESEWEGESFWVTQKRVPESTGRG